MVSKFRELRKQSQKLLPRRNKTKKVTNKNWWVFEKRERERKRETMGDELRRLERK